MVFYGVSGKDSCEFDDNKRNCLLRVCCIRSNITMYKQNITFNKCAKYTVEELLSMFRAEAQFICKKPEDVRTVAESALSDFIKCHGSYVRFV